MKRIARSLFLIVASTAVAVAAPASTSETLLTDNFTSAKLAKRDLSPSRGEWKMADGVATCTQDDELYKKNKDHGPIIWYDVSMTDATIRFAFRPQGCKTFVFTLNNGNGHVFRFIVSPTGLAVRAWPTQGSDATALSLMNPKAGSPSLKDGEWTPVELIFDGNECVLAIGSDFKQKFDNAALGFEKTKLGLGFSYGTLSLRDVSISVPKE